MSGWIEITDKDIDDNDDDDDDDDGQKERDNYFVVEGVVVQNGIL